MTTRSEGKKINPPKFQPKVAKFKPYHLKEIETYHLESGISNESRGDPTWRMESMQEAIRSTDAIAPSPPPPYPRILQKVQRDLRGATLPASAMRRDLGEGEKRSDSRPPRQGESFRPVLVQNPHGGFSTVRLAPSCAVGLRLFAGGLAGGESATCHGRRRRTNDGPVLCGGRLEKCTVSPRGKLGIGLLPYWAETACFIDLQDEKGKRN